MDIIGIITAGAVIGAIISALVTLLIFFLGPKLKEKYKLREIYLAPFRGWCGKFYGELDEFNRRYLLSKIRDCLKHSSIQIIDDYRAIHEVLIDSPIWIGRIEKEHKDSLIGKIQSKIHKSPENIDDYLKNFMDIVDRFWHELEGYYSLQLRDRIDIIKIPKNKRKEIAEKICRHFKKTRYPDTKKILEYLRKKKIP